MRVRALLDRAGTDGDALLLFGEPGVGTTLLFDAAADAVHDALAALPEEPTRQVRASLTSVLRLFEDRAILTEDGRRRAPPNLVPQRREDMTQPSATQFSHSASQRPTSMGSSARRPMVGDPQHDLELE
jgi:hypothetical protein